MMNYEKNFKKQNNGITLIALVITIIVLLILAGVSIAMLTGDNGILTQSKQAKIETAKGDLKEEINLMIQKRKIDEETGRKVSLKEDLENEISGEKVIEEIEGVTDACYLTKESQTVTVYEDGTIVEGKIIWDGVSKTKPEIDSEGNWHIKGASELKYFEEFVNGKLSEEETQGINIVETTTIYLENHIDLGARQENGTKTRGTNWEPIGKANQFLGIFEGNNYTIRGMYVDQASNFAGLFGKANEIKNLTLKDSYVIGGNCIGGMAGIGHKIENSHNENTTVISREGSYYAIGGVVGQLNEKMENCSNTGKIIANGKTADNGNSQCGGLVGRTSSKQEVIIKNCTNQGGVTGKGERVGGIVGNASTETTIKESKNRGEIVGESQLVGGIVGWTGANIEKSENQGKVIGKGERVGGIAGYTNDGTTIKESKNSGEIVGESKFVGGIAGWTGANIEKSENQGKVTGKGERVGGIAGEAGLGTTIKESKNSGEIVGESNNVGGIAGIIFGNVEDSHNIGNIKANAQVGGIIGQTGQAALSNISNCSNEGTIESVTGAQGGIIGWTSMTDSSGKVENVYNKGKMISKENATRIGGIIGRNSNTFQLINCYNKGTIEEKEGKEEIGSIIGLQMVNSNKISNSYYLNTLGVKAINNQDDPSKNIIGVSDDINSYEEFLNWIATKK